MSASTSSGMGLASWLLLAFILLKVLGVPPVGDWSWWWVMAPMWGPLLLVLVMAGVMSVYYAVRGRL